MKDMNEMSTKELNEHLRGQINESDKKKQTGTIHMMTSEEFFSKDDSEYEDLIDTEKYEQMIMEKEYEDIE